MAKVRKSITVPVLAKVFESIPAPEPCSAKPVTIVEGRDFFVVPSNRTRHGPRMVWGKRQFVRGALIAIGIPSPKNTTHATVSKLWRKVKKPLAEDSDFVAAELGSVSRRTVANELKKLQRIS